jgi:hypothetical protein
MAQEEPELEEMEHDDPLSSMAAFRLSPVSEELHVSIEHDAAVAVTLPSADRRSSEGPDAFLDDDDGPVPDVLEAPVVVSRPRATAIRLASPAAPSVSSSASALTSSSSSAFAMRSPHQHGARGGGRSHVGSLPVNISRPSAFGSVRTSQFAVSEIDRPSDDEDVAGDLDEDEDEGDVGTGAGLAPNKWPHTLTQTGYWAMADSLDLREGKRQNV